MTMTVLCPSLPLPPLLLSSLLLSLLASIPCSHSLSTTPDKPPPAMKYAFRPDLKKYDGMRVTSLHRYAIKGLSGDAVKSAKLNGGDGAFEDDRRFALLYDTSSEKFDRVNPVWLHKENFLCAFTAPELLATLDTEYRIETHDDDIRRLLTIWNREQGRLSPPILGPVDLARSSGREETSRYFSDLCGRKVHCVVAGGDGHSHQFGNTSSGVKNNDGDTRTIHIVNENTVREFSRAIYGKEKDGNLGAARFRPNVVIDGLEPWAEFDLIGKTIEVVPGNSKAGRDCARGRDPLRLRITSRTVRCAGVGVDPLRPDLGTIDVPKLLAKHFPQHGPYLGVYAVVDRDRTGASGGTISVGDDFRIVE